MRKQWRRHHLPRLVLAQCVCAVLAGVSSAQDPGAARNDAQAPGQEAAQRIAPDRSSPRAVVRSFLVAVQEAAAAKPARIDDAVACLDISKLEGDDPQAVARQLARRLYAVMDKIGLKLDEIPGETTDFSYTFYALDPDKPDSPAIIVEFDTESELWRFSAESLAAISPIEAALKGQEAAKPEPKVPDVPAARRTARATMMTFVGAMRAEPKNLTEAIKCLNPAGQDQASWGVRGRDLVVKLKSVMDKTALVVDVTIPDDPEGEPFAWHAGADGNIVLARIDDVGAYPEESEFAPQKGEWRFTPETVRSIETLYRALEKKDIKEEVRQTGVEGEQLTFGLWLERQFPEYLRGEFLSLALWKWVALLGVIALGWPVKILVAAVVAVVLGVWFKRRKITLERDVRRRAFRTAGWAGTALLWWHVVAADYLSLGVWVNVLLPAARLITGVTIVWVAYRLVDIVGGYIASNRDVRLTSFDDVLIPLLTKILRIFVVVVAIFLVLEMMGYKPTTVLGVIGIGGVAVAFAAQDTIGNFFGSITVLFDRPFGIGDWIVVGDIEGTVERVGFRSTRLRTFYNSVVTIPNSKMVNTQVDNYGARRFRRVKIMLSITYDTPAEKIDAFCEGIRELIRLHPYTRKDYYHVYFNQFAASSLDILLYAFFEVPDWGTELRERHHLFMDILRLARKLGIEFAFPTQTLWVERAKEGGMPAPATIAPGEQDPEVVGIKQAASMYKEVYGEDPTHRAPVVIHTRPRSQDDEAPK